ncbi:hypothetical protein ACFLUV_01830 [Elusimicrobiota bacterium]
MCFSAIERILAIGWLDNHGNWKPPKYQQLNKSIDMYNSAFANNNPYFFTDKNWDMQKQDGIYRIAVLGDSFIWGDGIVYNKVWSYKLRKKINAKYKNVELLSWGKNGWHTGNEFEFMKDIGINYNIDLVVIGFVINDPNYAGNNKAKYLKWHEKQFFKKLAIVFPNTTSYFLHYIYTFLCSTVLNDYGYMNWVDKLYTEGNLKRYSKLLQSFSIFCKQNSVELLFVLTPHNCNTSYQKKYSEIIRLLKKEKIEYLNLFPAVYSKFKNYPIKKLWSNPANGHPGELLTDVYADEVYKYFKKNTLNRLEKE